MTRAVRIIVIGRKEALAQRFPQAPDTCFMTNATITETDLKSAVAIDRTVDLLIPLVQRSAARAALLRDSASRSYGKTARRRPLRRRR